MSAGPGARGHGWDPLHRGSPAPPIPADPASPPCALLPRRELPDGGARPSVAQLKQLVVSALRELHGEVRWGRAALLPSAGGFSPVCRGVPAGSAACSPPVGRGQETSLHFPSPVTCSLLCSPRWDSLRTQPGCGFV